MTKHPVFILFNKMLKTFELFWDIGTLKHFVPVRSKKLWPLLPSDPAKNGLNI